MRTEEVNIRDPFVLPCAGAYYLYGTRSASCWRLMDGFDAYRSTDLGNWDGPVEIFHRPEGFFADREYWAPECYLEDGAFYLVTTLGQTGGKKGIYALRSSDPLGQFAVYSKRLTPHSWECLDGTLYFEEGDPVLVFSHAFQDDPRGWMCAVRLKPDLSEASGSPVALFPAADAPWAHPVPFAKAEFGIEGDCYFTDGPCVFKEDGRLFMTWSSWGTQGYAVGIAVSDSGVMGKWKQLERPLWPANGGHGSVFRDFSGAMRFTLHYPNDKGKEHPIFRTLRRSGEAFILE